MESVAVFLVGIAVIWLVFWIVRNDGVPTIRDQTGLFRMRAPAEPDSGPGGGESPPGPAAIGGAPPPRE